MDQTSGHHNHCLLITRIWQSGLKNSKSYQNAFRMIPNTPVISLLGRQQSTIHLTASTSTVALPKTSLFTIPIDPSMSLYKIYQLVPLWHPHLNLLAAATWRLPVLHCYHGHAIQTNHAHSQSWVLLCPLQILQHLLTVSHQSSKSLTRSKLTDQGKDLANLKKH